MTQTQTEKRKARIAFERATFRMPETEKLRKYLQMVHGIHVPKTYPSQVQAAHSNFRGTPFRLDIDLVDTVVEACNYWKDYVVDWDALVCHEVLSMVRIHTSVIHVYFLRKNGFVLKKEPSPYRETTVTMAGELRFDDRY